MFHELLTDPKVHAQIQSILVDIATLIGTFVAIAIGKAATAVRQSNMNLVKKMVAERIVSYAENTIQSSGADKAAYVADQLHAKFPNLDQTEIQHLIEAAVASMKSQQGDTK